MAPYIKRQVKSELSLHPTRKIGHRTRSYQHALPAVTFVDTLFIVGETKRKFWVNSWTIAAISDVFKVMLRDRNWSYCRLDTPIKIVDANPDAFELLINYYKDQRPVGMVEMKLALDAYYIGHKYNILPFMKALEVTIRRLVDAENVLQVLIYAKLYDNSFLRSACWSYMERNAAKVLRSAVFPMLPKEEFFEFLENTRLVIREFELFQGGLKWCRLQSQLPENREENLYHRLTFSLGCSFMAMTSSEREFIFRSELVDKCPAALMVFKMHQGTKPRRRRNTCRCRRKRAFCLVCTWGETLSGAPKPVDGKLPSVRDYREPCYRKSVCGLFETCYRPEVFLRCECVHYNACPAFPNGNTDTLYKRVLRELAKKNVSCVHQLLL